MDQLHVTAKQLAGKPDRRRLDRESIHRDERRKVRPSRQPNRDVVGLEHRVHAEVRRE